MDIKNYVFSNATEGEKESLGELERASGDNYASVDSRRKTRVSLLRLERQVSRRVITKLVKILLMTYKSQIRQSWMEGPTTAEATDALHTELVNIFGDKLHTEKEILGIKFKE